MHSHQFTDKTEISHTVILGDSLSDSGTADRRLVFGFIPMALLAGLAGKSPQGRFTNGYTWSDNFSATLEEEFLIRKSEHKHAHHEQKQDEDATDRADDILTGSHDELHALRKPLLDTTDIADEVISDRRFVRKLQHYYTLDNNMFVTYHGRDFVRNYDEGGLTSHDWSHDFTFNVTRYVSRKILSTLQKKRELMLQHDRQREIPFSQKKRTLVIEWSGANDLITVNAAPTHAEADLSIQDRILNVEKLIGHGYQHFILFNMPDLSLTPRLQDPQGAEAAAARKNAQAVVNYLNASLQAKVNELQEKYKAQGCTIEIYDVNKVFTAVYQDTLNQTHRFPGKFEKDKLKIPFTESKDFNDKHGVSHAPGYMFWNDVHPSAAMHEILADDFYKQAQSRYHFSAPQPETAAMLCDAFIKKYHELLRRDVLGHFGFFRNHNLPLLDYHKDPEQAVVMILKHALENSGGRTKEAIKDLQWIDGKGKINVEVPALKVAAERMAGAVKVAQPAQAL